MKQRLVGAAVLVALAVVFIPMLLNETGTPDASIKGSNIPPKPQGEFSSHIIPLDTGKAPASGAPKSRSPVPAVPAPSPEKAPAAAKSVQSVAVPKVRVGVTAWVIQLGSFSSKDNARALEARLRKAGYSAFVQKTDSGEGAVYRVQVGPELLRAKADKLRDRLEKDVKLKGIVVRYP